MIYCRLLVFFGYLLFGFSFFGLMAYFALMILVEGFFGDDFLLNIIIGCFFVGLLLFQLKSLLIDFLAERVAKRGSISIARVLGVEHTEERNVEGRGLVDWYKLKVETPAALITGENRGYFDARFEQLFMRGAKEWLIEGATIPIKYDRGLRLLIVDHQEAYPRLRSDFSLIRRP